MDKARRLEIQRKYRERNREKLKQAYAEYCASNPDKVRAQKRAYAERNQERERVRAREKYRRNWEYYNARARVRNAQKRAGEGCFTRADVDRIFKEQNKKCAYCKKRLTIKTRTIDHIKALKLGGTNQPNNIQITCMRCNRSKSARPAMEFAQSLGMLL